jgi:ribosomal protein S27AE
MATHSTAVMCPNCKLPMNHHAEKMVYVGDETQSDPVLGGVIQQMHTCPRCGGSASRIATGSVR